MQKRRSPALGGLGIAIILTAVFVLAPTGLTARAEIYEDLLSEVEAAERAADDVKAAIDAKSSKEYFESISVLEETVENAIGLAKDAGASSRNPFVRDMGKVLLIAKYLKATFGTWWAPKLVKSAQSVLARWSDELREYAQNEAEKQGSTSGEQSGTSGKQSGSSGEQSGTTGKQSGSSGGQSGSSGGQSGSSGEESGSSGEESGSSGEESGSSGEESGSSGEESGSSGGQDGSNSSSGDQSASSGDTSNSTGDQSASSGDTTNSTGDENGSSGDTSSSAGGQSGSSGAPTDSAGWTDLTPSSDSRVLYVSSSSGSDSNAGTEQSPLRSTSAAYAKLRNGYPDWMLLKRGDTWSGALHSGWGKSGRSSSEPMVVGAYGSGARPLFQNTGDPGLGVSGCQHLAFLDIEVRGGNGQGNGFWLYKNVSDVLIEGCAASRYLQCFYLNGKPGAVTNIRLRRCVFTDAYSGGSGHSQGGFCWLMSGLLIEECVFDHNGWSSASSRTRFNHNLYMKECENVVLRRNVFGRGSALAVKVCSDVAGGFKDFEITDNLLVSNIFGIGLNYGSQQVANSHENGTIMRNVIESVCGVADGVEGGYGLEVRDTKNCVYRDNVIRDNTTNGWGVKITGSTTGLVFTGNIIHNWKTYDWAVPWKGTQPSGNYTNQSDSYYVDGTRNTARYHQSIGGSATIESFLSEARQQRKGYWRDGYTGGAATSWILAGFVPR